MDFPSRAAESARLTAGGGPRLTAWVKVVTSPGANLGRVTKIPVRDVFARFSAENRWALERFARKVDELNESELAQARIGFGMTMIPGDQTMGGQAWRIRVEGASKKEVKAAVLDFRQLYTDSNPTSATRILKILSESAHARATDVARHAIEDLKGMRKALHDRKKTDPHGAMFEETSLGESVVRTPEELIKTWFNGEAFHDDRDLDQQVGPEGEPMSEMLMFGLQTAIQDHIKYWTRIRDLVVEVLKDDALRPAA